ncbi:putative uncharacterized protein DDB_G0271606 [Clytia hemisphaerica]
MESLTRYTLSFLLVLAGLMYTMCSKDLCFGVVGDIGGMPKPPFQTTAQKKVANLLAKVIEQNNCQFIVGVGDNFYFNGVKNVEDPRFFWTYERTYSHSALKIPWYMIAGNHDHAANVSAQIAYSKVSKRWHFPDFFYNKVFKIPDSTKTLELLMIDTTMLCWHSKKSNSPSPKVQWKWIEDALKNSKADYLVVAGHHPMYSSSNHGNTRCLVDRLKPLFEKYSVNAYFSGHDHNLQHIHETDSEVHYFISGSGNFVDQRFNNRHNLPLGSSKFEYAENCGFNLVHITKDNMKLKTFTVEPGRDLGSIYDVIMNPRTVSKQSNGLEDNDQSNFMLINNDGGNQIDRSTDIEHLTKSIKNDKSRSNLQNENQNFGSITEATTTSNIQQKLASDDDSKRTNKKYSNDAPIDEKPTPVPATLIDTNKLTIDNLSDIPLSSYSNLSPLIPIEQGESMTTKSLNKTGNNLKDFILERLPVQKVANNKNLKQNRTSTTTKNNPSDILHTNSSITRKRQDNSYYQNSNYLSNIQPGYTGYNLQYPVNSYYYQTLYQQGFQPQSQVYNYWGANNLQYPSVQIRQPSTYLYQQQSGYLSYQQQQQKSLPSEKTKRETVVVPVSSNPKNEMLSNFFEKQNSKTANVKSAL